MPTLDHKDRYHFWTGFLLIVRIGLFVGFTLNTSKGPILNLTLISATASLLPYDTDINNIINIIIIIIYNYIYYIIIYIYNDYNIIIIII